MYVDHTGDNPLLYLLSNPYSALTLVTVIVLVVLVYDATHEQVIGNAFTDAIENSSNKIHNINDSTSSLDSESEATSSEILTTSPSNHAYFTVNPYDFKPNGLVMTEYAGTGNGKIIKWSDPTTHAAVFEWDEDLNYGPHYHILINGKHDGTHIPPGTEVPDPWKSLYFGGIT